MNVKENPNNEQTEIAEVELGWQARQIMDPTEVATLWASSKRVLKTKGEREKKSVRAEKRDRTAEREKRDVSASTPSSVAFGL